jgi:glycosyltransferase involved in cell wall biosynthesis
MMKSLWITWEFQRRNLGISSALGWQLAQIDIKGPMLKRYLFSLWKTFLIVLDKKPDVIAVQNPSIVLAVFAMFLSRIFGIKIIMDAHNSGIYPAEGKAVFFMSVANWLQKKADLVIVTNETLKKVVESNGGRGFVLPDKISDLPVKIKGVTLDGKINVAFICTYSDDEPYREVIKAAKLLSKDIVIYFTGSYHGKVSPTEISKNVRLLGFVSEGKYWSLLRSADIIMDLTLRENCLVCGAYEALALCKPLVLSNTNALKLYFNKGCVYVDPTAHSIASGINEAVNDVKILQKDIVMLQSDLRESWSNKLDELISEINDIVPY